MYYDLNVPWSPDNAELPRIAAFLYELGYNVIALTHTIDGKIPPNPTNPIPPNPFPDLPNLRVLTRCTLLLSDPAQTQKLALLTPLYDILCIRPTTEKLLLTACSALDHVDLISLDLSTRLPFHLKHKVLGTALARGLKFEVAYSAIAVGDAGTRRNVLANAAQLVRATRGKGGKGIVVSSGAGRAGGLRAPVDVVNLAGLWGMSGEKGREAVGMEARAVVVHAEMRRRSWRGIVDVVDGGEVVRVVGGGGEKVGGKRKAEDGGKGGGEGGGGGGGGGKGGQQQQQREQQLGQGNKKARKKGKNGGEGVGAGGS
ncbi:RNase P subunit p30-domain-containing protein [Peziza echinospora]|nr:RNase P subunit p30-domain-containing protein [Peziza echinospora]